MDWIPATAHDPAQPSTILPLGAPGQCFPQLAEGVLPRPLLIPPPKPALQWTGARRLLLAVLQEAVGTFLKGCNARTARERQSFCEVQIWFSSEEDHWLYSFESICQHLHLDPGYIRRGLARYQQAVAELPPQTPPALEGQALSAPKVACSGQTPRETKRILLQSLSLSAAVA